MVWSLSGERICARVRADGAELCSLCGADGQEMLWQAGPEWPRHAPILFPIVGRLRDDRLLHDGQVYRMTQHGFARDRRFEWLQREPTICRLALRDDAATRAIFPFGFRLEIGYEILEASLVMSACIINTGETVLPASFGAHPAFRWPLGDGLAKADHRLEFAAPEAAPVRRLQGGLLLAERFPTPIQGRTLALSESLFAADALILDQPASRSVRYCAPGVGGIELAWEGFSELGLWSRPGAAFLCIEPWHGMASPSDFDGEFATKPGLLMIPPGERRLLSLRMTLP